MTLFVCCRCLHNIHHAYMKLTDASMIRAVTSRAVTSDIQAINCAVVQPQQQLIYIALHCRHCSHSCSQLLQAVVRSFLDCCNQG